MKAKCPHCGKDIDLVEPADLERDYGINSNALQHRRAKGMFPEPWLRFSNRQIWLRDTIKQYIEDRGRTRLETTVEDLLKTLESLPEDGQAEARRMLERKLSEKR